MTGPADQPGTTPTGRIKDGTYGEALLATAGPDAAIRLEGQRRPDHGAVAIDRWLADLTADALRGTPPVRIVRADHNRMPAQVELSRPAPLGPADADGTLSLAWGTCRLATTIGVQPRFALTVAARQRTTVTADAAAVATRDLLVPWFGVLYRPITVAAAPPDVRPDLQRDTADTWVRIGLPTDVLDAIWTTPHPSNLDQIAAARQRFLAALAGRVTATETGRWRHLITRPLIEAYYAPKQRPPRRRTALRNKSLRALHATWFGGDWAAFLHYLGEDPHADDLAVEDAGGIPAPPVPTVDHPSITARFDALRRWWEEFDRAHATLEPDGTYSDGERLDGRDLVDLLRPGVPTPRPFVRTDDPERADPVRPARAWVDPFVAPVTDRILSQPLRDTIGQLWGTSVERRWPDRLLDETAPHDLIADIVGVAGKVWHEIALTCWYLWAGPYARCGVAELQERHAAELAELQTAGMPVNPTLFTDLTRIDAADPAPYPSMGDGMSVGVTVSADGQVHIHDGQPDHAAASPYLLLRDTVSRHRRDWADRYLHGWLERTALTDLAAVTADLHRRTVERSGKPPTLKQAAPATVPIANRWFAGDISALVDHLGGRPVAPPVPMPLPIGDTTDFLNEAGRRMLDTPAARAIDPPLSDLAMGQRMLQYLRVRQARGNPSTATQMGAARQSWWGTDAATGYRMLADAVEATLTDRN